MSPRRQSQLASDRVRDLERLAVVVGRVMVAELTVGDPRDAGWLACLVIIDLVDPVTQRACTQVVVTDDVGVTLAGAPPMRITQMAILLTQQQTPTYVIIIISIILAIQSIYLSIYCDYTSLLAQFWLVG